MYVYEKIVFNLCRKTNRDSTTMLLQSLREELSFQRCWEQGCLEFRMFTVTKIQMTTGWKERDFFPPTVCLSCLPLPAIILTSAALNMLIKRFDLVAVDSIHLWGKHTWPQMLTTNIALFIMHLKTKCRININWI